MPEDTWNDPYWDDDGFDEEPEGHDSDRFSEPIPGIPKAPETEEELLPF